MVIAGIVTITVSGFNFKLAQFTWEKFNASVFILFVALAKKGQLFTVINWLWNYSYVN